jgi:hypothetical protein
MRKYLFSLVCLAGMLIAGCKHPTVYKEVQAAGKFALQVPEYMRATAELFGEGKCSMQYENDSMQIYLLVFDTARKDLNEGTLKEYYDSIVAQPSVQGAIIASPKPAMVNGDSALVTEMTATLSGTPVFYKIEVIATPARFYYILVWCRKDRKDALNDDLNKVINSFTDLNHNKV